MSDQYHKLVLECTSNAFIEDIVCDLRIDSTQRVIKKYDFSLRVDSASKAYPRLLSTRDIDASLADRRVLSIFKVLDIVIQAGSFQSCLKSSLIILLSKENIFFDGS